MILCRALPYDILHHYTQPNGVVKHPRTRIGARGSHIHTSYPYIHTARFARGDRSICGPTSGHNRPTGRLLAHWSSSAGPRGTTRPASCRSAPPLGRTDLPVRPVAHDPETVPDGGASEAAAQPLCALRAVAGASRARLPSWPKRSRRLRRLARAHSDLSPPQLPNRPRLLPPQQGSAAAA